MILFHKLYIYLKMLIYQINWSPDEVLIEILGFSIYVYSLMFILAFFVGFKLFQSFFIKENVDQKYLDPRNKKICEIEKIIEFINSRRKIDKFFPNNLYCLNLTPWKARQIHRYTKELTGIKVSAFR